VTTPHDTKYSESFRSDLTWLLNDRFLQYMHQMSASRQASSPWYEHPYELSKLGLSAAKSVYNVAFFQDMNKLGPAKSLNPSNELRNDQNRLHILVQKLAPFISELRSGDRAEYAEKVEAVHFTIQKGIDEVGTQAEESTDRVSIDLSCRSIN